MKSQDVAPADMSRLEGVVSRELAFRTAVIVGASGGSYAIEKLARSGIGALRIAEFDVVKMGNLPRTIFTVADAKVEVLKAEAMADRLEAVAPWTDVRICPRDITTLSQEELRALFDGADVAIDYTDSLDARTLINKWSVDLGIAALFAGVHQGALGGRVILTIPGKTGCYRCIAKARYQAFEAGEKSVDIEGGQGSVIDLQLVDMIGLRLVLGYLDREQDTVMGRFFKRVGDRTDVMVRCDPTYQWGTDLWDAVLADVPEPQRSQIKDLQCAGDTLWMRTERDPNCPVCSWRWEQKGAADEANNRSGEEPFHAPSI